MRTLRVETIDRIDYGPMHELQRLRQRKVIDGHAEDTLYLLEHEPVLTLGKNSGSGHILASAEELERRGVALHETGRGGDVTFHGPGQLVGYPIVALQPGERDIRRFVWNVEEILLRTCADFGVQADRVDGLRGIWVGYNKIGAIGIRVARWTTMHGFALNVSTDLSFFDLIVPCGIEGRGVTSLANELAVAPSIDAVRESAACHTADVLKRALVVGTEGVLSHESA
ncbi:MAG: lipoyl(octanoyl) transferase LipB [Myxococcota bacterium]